MKRLKTGAVNTLSFVKNIGYVVNEFDVTLEKVVGNGTLSLTELQDLNGLDTCKDFIQLNIDLVANSLEGGEYYLTLTNGSSSVKYLCNVESYSYQVHGTDIYSDSVVLGSTDLSNLNSGQSSDSGSTAGGTGSTGSSGSTSPSFDVEIWDPEYGTLSEPYQVRTDNWTWIASISNISSSIQKLRAVIEDSSANIITKTQAKSSINQIMFDIENEAINFGDVAQVKYEGLDADDNVLYTSSIYTVYIPAKVQMYVAESLADANDMQLNGRAPINYIESVNTETYNLYVYVEENYGNLTIDFQAINAGTDASVYPIFGFNPPSFSGSNQVMTEVATNVRPSLATATAEVTTYFFAGFEWSDGTTTPVQNGFYAANYSAGANKIVSLPYAEETITIDGDTFTLKGYSPIVFNNAGITTNDPTLLRITVGDGNYNYDLLNRTSIIKVQQGYTDGTVLEETITSNFSIVGSPPASSFDYNMYITQLDTNKTPDFTKVWTKSKDGNWYNIDNSSSDFPHFRFDH
jgi:hypothetical protein